MCHDPAMVFGELIQCYNGIVIHWDTKLTGILCLLLVIHQFLQYVLVLGALCWCPLLNANSEFMWLKQSAEPSPSHRHKWANTIPKWAIFNSKVCFMARVSVSQLLFNIIGYYLPLIIIGENWLWYGWSPTYGYCLL